MFKKVNSLPKPKRLTLKVIAASGSYTCGEVKTTGIGTAHGYSKETQETMWRREEALFPCSWSLLVGDLHYRGPAICPGSVAKLEVELKFWFPVKCLNHKTVILDPF